MSLSISLTINRQSRTVTLDDPRVTLLDLLRKWRHATTTQERAAAWASMLALYTDQVFSIGVVNATLQPILASTRLRNIPEKGLYSFNPTCYLGVYHPDAFWLAGEG